ncbi:MAG: hypothetical protein ABEJ02_01640 [Candidatus Paceibacteria bacterium]
MQEPQESFDPKKLVNMPQIKREDFNDYASYVDSANFPNWMFSLDEGTKLAVASKKVRRFL